MRDRRALQRGRQTAIRGICGPGRRAHRHAPLRPRIGHSLVLSDKPGEESITIHSGDGSISITLDQARGVLVVHSDNDIEVKAGVSMTLTAGGDVVIDGGGSVTVNAGSTLKLAAGADVDVSGSMIKLN